MRLGLVFFEGCSIACLVLVSRPFHGCGLLLWRIILFAILSSIWRERNGRIFRGFSSSVAMLITEVSIRVVKWVLIRKEFENLNMNDILSNWGRSFGLWEKEGKEGQYIGLPRQLVF